MWTILPSLGFITTGSKGGGQQKVLMNIGLEITLYQAFLFGSSALAWVYAWGKTHQLFTNLISRVEKLEERVEKLDHLFKLSPEKAMRYLHTHEGCKTIIRN